MRERGPRRSRDIIDRPRGVAQSGSAPGWGPGGRRFKSCLPDWRKAPLTRGFLFGQTPAGPPSVFHLCTVLPGHPPLRRRTRLGRPSSTNRTTRRKSGRTTTPARHAAASLRSYGLSLRSACSCAPSACSARPFGLCTSASWRQPPPRSRSRTSLIRRRQLQPRPLRIRRGVRPSVRAFDQLSRASCRTHTDSAGLQDPAWGYVAPTRLRDRCPARSRRTRMSAGDRAEGLSQYDVRGSARCPFGPAARDN